MRQRQFFFDFAPREVTKLKYKTGVELKQDKYYVTVAQNIPKLHDDEVLERNTTYRSVPGIQARDNRKQGTLESVLPGSPTFSLA